MGICSSSEATDVVTVKLILQDGRLQEYSYPVKVSYVLQKNPACFICNSDEMEFDDVVSAINADEELQPGQLYFALPLNRLRQPLQAEEMAALAVKASSALTKNAGRGKCGSGRSSLSAVVFSEGYVRSCRRVSSATAVGGSGGGRSRRNKKFTANLYAIPE